MGKKDVNRNFTEMQADIFTENDYVVYPYHGVGKIIAITEEEICLGVSEKFLKIHFQQEKWTLKSLKERHQKWFASMNAMHGIEKQKKFLQPGLTLEIKA